MCKGWIMGGDKSFLLGFLMIFYFCSVCVQSGGPLAPALYVFGDSLLDSGNNNLLPTLARANFRPYGTDFASGATGRFTNGRTVADLIAEHLGLPYSPPYMSFERSMVTTGLNYASGTCGILSETGKYLGNCLSLSDQIDLFQRTVEQDLPTYYGSPQKLSKDLSKSIFLISIGSNDYINNYLQPNIYDSSQRYSPQSFAKILIANLSQQLQKLQNLGVRKVVVFEIGPIGCIPWITGQYKHDGRQCVEEINRLAILFNNELGKMLENLTSTHNGSSFILGHVHGLGYDAIINPSNYGLIDSSEPCCITVWANGTATCIPELLPCRNIDKKYFWDGFHLTETVYSVIAKRCISDNTVCVPKTIDLLVQV